MSLGPIGKLRVRVGTDPFACDTSTKDPMDEAIRDVSIEGPIRRVFDVVPAFPKPDF